MTSEQVGDICRERVRNWNRRLVEEHATPALHGRVGHDHNSGAVVICTTEDMHDEYLRAFLRKALAELGG
jgi:hypothetical protein